MNNNKINNNKINNKDIDKVFWRWFFFNSSGWNYEKMQGLGYYYSMYPIIEKNYSDLDERKEAAKNHLQFFNSNNTPVPLILGTNIALEKEGGIESKDAVTSLKTGLMGPLAGIGDTLFHVIPSTIIGSIASYLALEGNPIGLLLWLVWGVGRFLVMRGLMSTGYKEGSRLVSEIGGKLQKVTQAANVLGVTVVGALIPTVVNASFSYEFNYGEVNLPLQEIADQIMPGLAPILIVLFTYWLLGRKKMNSTIAIFLLIFLSILGSILNIF